MSLGILKRQLMFKSSSSFTNKLICWIWIRKRFLDWLPGWVRWDDENSDIDFPNTFRGDVPEGIYGENTVVYFCCSKTGSKSTPIHLPYGPPFYLLAFGSPKCQQVHNYEVSKKQPTNQPNHWYTTFIYRGWIYKYREPSFLHYTPVFFADVSPAFVSFWDVIKKNWEINSCS